MSGFVRVCAVSEVAEESALAVELDDQDVAIVNSGGTFYAIADRCSHAAIALSEGDVYDAQIECYLHGSTFDLRTGNPLSLPATEPVPVYRCQVVDGDVLVDVSQPLDPEQPETEQAQAKIKETAAIKETQES